MKIERISVYRVESPLPFTYRWSGGRSLSTLDDTIVRIDTDSGISGFGESCPWGTRYVPAFAEGVRAGLTLVAPGLIGMDPRCLQEINDQMDTALSGHPYVKHAIDVACWDILGKSADMPVYDLLGGRLTDKARARVGISEASPDEMVRHLEERIGQDYSHFSIKVGTDADQDIARLMALSRSLKAGQTMVADANGGWMLNEAMRVTQALRDASNIYIEQPCRTYHECLAVRRASSLPMILDECIMDITDVARAYADNACDVINIKASRVGGITRSRQIRDLSVSFGMALYIMDTGNTELGGAVTMHLAHSTPEKAMLGVWNTKDWRIVDMAKGAPVGEDGKVFIDGVRPGLGLTFDDAVLGDPVAVYS